MNKRKLIYWISGIVIVAVVGYHYAVPLAISKILTAGPRTPKLDYPVTYEIGWWSYQNGLTIKSFDVEIVESNLNLFNSKSLISYSISGTISNKGNWKPFIKEIHISQRILQQSNSDNYRTFNADSTYSFEAIVEITPIIDVKEDDTYNGEPVNFELTNEMIVNSLHWGNNQIIFRCTGLTRELRLAQRK